MNKSILNIAILAAIGASFAVPAFAADSATQTVTYAVSAINEIAVSSPTVSLTVDSAVAGSAPTSVSDATTTYAVTTNETARKITGAINTSMPTGVTLSVGLAAPSGALSAGAQPLSTTAVDLVTSMETVNDPSKVISYQLAATSAAGVVASAAKTVTLTVTAED